MSRLYFDTVKDTGWSIGFGFTNPGCKCLIGMAYLWRIKLGFVFDFFCPHNAIVDRMHDSEELQVRSRGRGESVEVISKGDPRHTAVVNALKRGKGNAS